MNHKIDRIQYQPSSRLKPVTGKSFDIIFFENFLQVVLKFLSVDRKFLLR